MLQTRGSALRQIRYKEEGGIWDRVLAYLAASSFKRSPCTCGKPLAARWAPGSRRSNNAHFQGRGFTMLQVEAEVDIVWSE